MIETGDLNVVAMRTRLAVLWALHAASMPAAVAADLKAASEDASPVLAMVKGLEPLYAALKDGVVAVADDLGKVGYLMGEHGFHGQGARGFAIYNACRRALGEDVPGDDPDVAAKYLPAPEIDPAPE